MIVPDSGSLTYAIFLNLERYVRTASRNREIKIAVDPAELATGEGTLVILSPFSTPKLMRVSNAPTNFSESSKTTSPTIDRPTKLVPLRRHPPEPVNATWTTLFSTRRQKL